MQIYVLQLTILFIIELSKTYKTTIIYKQPYKLYIPLIIYNFTEITYRNKIEYKKTVMRINKNKLCVKRILKNRTLSF